MIRELKNWTKVDNEWAGHYRYVIAAKCAYEIFVEYWTVDTPVETAKASLCLTGLWSNKDGSNTLEREWLAKELPICELLNIAYEDDKKNNK